MLVPWWDIDFLSERREEVTQSKGHSVLFSAESCRQHLTTELKDVKKWTAKVL
jgi:hypothetical protein